MTDPISRTELLWRVDNVFYDLHPDAPRPLGKNGPANLRAAWVELCDKLLDEEVNRVYWARHPDAPTELDATSPEWEPWRVKWNEIKAEVEQNRPAPEDVELQNAVSDDGTLDLSYLKAAIRERLVDMQNEGTLLADTRDEVITAADELAEEVGKMAMAADTVHGSWESSERVITGPGDQKIRITVTGYWGDGYFTGSLGTTHSEI